MLRVSEYPSVSTISRFICTARDKCLSSELGVWLTPSIQMPLCLRGGVFILASVLRLDAHCRGRPLLYGECECTRESKAGRIELSAKRSAA